jgi:hypothetical protein
MPVAVFWKCFGAIRLYNERNLLLFAFQREGFAFHNW